MLDTFLGNVEQYLHTSPWLAVAAVFVGGILTASNPCVLVMIPLMMGFVAGQQDARPGPLRAFLHSLVFVLGLGLTFTAGGGIGSGLGLGLGGIIGVGNGIGVCLGGGYRRRPQRWLFYKMVISREYSFWAGPKPKTPRIYLPPLSTLESWIISLSVVPRDSAMMKPDGSTTAASRSPRWCLKMTLI